MSKARDIASAPIAPSTVSATELGYVDGVTSAIQTQLDAKTAKSTLTTKGDLYAATAASTPARLAVGTNGQVLTADSTAATGLAYTTISAGGMTLITETVASANSNINLTSIPSTYKQLMLVWSGLYPSNTTTNWGLRLNNDSTAGIYNGVISNSTAVTGFSGSDGDDSNGGIPLFGYQAQSSSTDYQMQSKGVLLIDNYTSTTKFKFYTGESSWRANGSVYRAPRVTAVYNSLSAITSIDIVQIAGTGTLSNATSTSIRLYGLS